MIPYFPDKIGAKGISVYFLSLAAVTLLFFSHAMPLIYILLGAIWVIGFFSLSASRSRSWLKYTSSRFQSKLFWTAFTMRILWVIFSYFFYMAQTGIPFEFDAADSQAYHELAEWWAGMSWKQLSSFVSLSGGVSDLGYPFLLTLLYKIVGPSVLIARIVKVFLSSFTCILIYRLASRNIGETPGRMAAVFSTFMPNLIIYCGLHVKETEMIFLIVSFMERSDYLIRSRKLNIKYFILPILLALSLFFFRTVLGAVAIISLGAGLLFSTNNILGKFRVFLIVILGVAFVSTIVGGAIATEVEENWDGRVVNAIRKREHQERDNGIKWAKYATSTVMVPAVFIMPLSTMVDTGQENQMVMHGGNFVRNFMGIFVMIALFNVLFIKKNWKDFALIGSFVIGYLLVIALSGYANAERFLLPALPGLLIMTAYGISDLNSKSFRFAKYWYIVVVLLEIAWAYFKLGSRGLF